MHCSREGIWKGQILVADIEELEKLDASEIYPRRINAKEVLRSQTRDEFIFPIADGRAKLPGRDYEFRVPTHKAGTNREGVKISVENFKANGDFSPLFVALCCLASSSFGSWCFAPLLCWVVVPSFHSSG